MKKNRFPKEWDAERVSRVLAHYEKQTEQEAIREDESAFKSRGRAVVEVPVELMPLIREILAQYKPIR